MLEWLANNYKNFGATLEIITDKSQEGSQFVRGFGGIGGQYLDFIYCINVYLKIVVLTYNKILRCLLDRHSTLQSGFSVSASRRAFG